MAGVISSCQVLEQETMYWCVKCTRIVRIVNVYTNVLCIYVCIYICIYVYVYLDV